MSNEIKIEKLAYGGDGIGQLESGKKVFVKGALPGDTVRFETIAEHARYDSAVAVDIIEASPDRVHQPCPYHALCGGCPWQMIGYEAQLKWKRQFVVDSIERIGKMGDADGLVAPCVESKHQWNHRNKIELVPTMANGKLELGYHALASDQVVPVERCLLLSKKNEKAPKALTGALRYLKAEEHGLERVELRHSRRTGSLQVALWTTPDAFPRKAVADVLKGAFNYTSLVRVLVKDMKARKIAGVEVLAEDEHWHETLGDFDMSVSAPSFFQVNTAGADRLVRLAMEGLRLSENDICCDLYCGAGTFTLPLAAETDLVYAVESYGSSVRDLRRNLFDNGLDAEVIGGDAVREARGIGRVDKLVIDPPYSGMDGKIFEGIASMAPKRVALVSCNPTTLARDLQGFVDLGYEIEGVTPVDLFPQTYHVETVTILRRKGSAKLLVAAAEADEEAADDLENMSESGQGNGRKGGRKDHQGDHKGSHGPGHASGRKDFNRSGHGERKGARKGGRQDGRKGGPGDGHRGGRKADHGQRGERGGSRASARSGKGERSAHPRARGPRPSRPNARGSKGPRSGQPGGKGTRGGGRRDRG